MKRNLFRAALEGKNTHRPPVWFMRQAGRYHSHYQELKSRYTFEEICKIPEVACEAAMGPIRDFDFDAAILFSDILFPLEVMGMGLKYAPGPILDWKFRSPDDLRKFETHAGSVSQLNFQAEAMQLLKKELDPTKGLIGFVGGPTTLYSYATEGTHQGELPSAKAGFTDGRFLGFQEILLPLLAENMALQFKAGADCMAILDTCVGDFALEDFQKFGVPALKKLITLFHEKCPDAPIVYYSKGTHGAHWKALEGLEIRGLGIDWNPSLSQTLKDWGGKYAIQGNFSPEDMLLPRDTFEAKLRAYFQEILENTTPEDRTHWICGLGHGILRTTPEENVKLFIKIQRELFDEDR